MASATDNGPPATDQCIVRVEHLCKRYQTESETREILRDVSFTLAAGQALAIMGPSGSGKTTLLSIIGTLDTPTSGSVSILGSNPFALDERELALFRNATIGFVFQAHHLLPQCSVLENVLLPTVVHGRGEGSTERALRLLDRVGLTARIHDRPARLSGGERQRAAVVRALINGPRVLLADEPTGALDTTTSGQIMALLEEANRGGVTLILVTHEADVATRASRTIRIRDGQVR